MLGRTGGGGHPLPQGRAVCALHVSWTSEALCFPGSSSCRLLPGTGTKQCYGLGGDAGLAEMPPQTSRLEQRSLSGLGESGDASLTVI